MEHFLAKFWCNNPNVLLLVYSRRESRASGSLYFPQHLKNKISSSLPHTQKAKEQLVSLSLCPRSQHVLLAFLFPSAFVDRSLDPVPQPSVYRVLPFLCLWRYCSLRCGRFFLSTCQYYLYLEQVVENLSCINISFSLLVKLILLLT